MGLLVRNGLSETSLIVITSLCINLDIFTPEHRSPPVKNHRTHLHQVQASYFLHITLIMRIRMNASVITYKCSYLHSLKIPTPFFPSPSLEL